MSGLPSCDSKCPSDPEQAKIRGMAIGAEMRKRLNDGTISDDRIQSFELEWSQALECIDESHTTKNELTIKQAKDYLLGLEQYAYGGNEPACEDCKMEVLKCLTENPDEHLNCSDHVQAFSECVDEMLYTTSKKSMPMVNKKISYKEKFDEIVV